MPVSFLRVRNETLPEMRLLASPLCLSVSLLSEYVTTQEPLTKNARNLITGGFY
jgi:hypothetical protein